MTLARCLLAGSAALVLGSAAIGADRVDANANEVVVADFNSGHKPNNLGGDFGAWIADPGDPMQGSIDSFDRDNRYGDMGYALRLIYSVASNKPAFGGLWMQLKGLDASAFDTLSFRVKGDAALGFTTNFRVELKDVLDQTSRFEVSGISAQWQDISIPLDRFVGMANRRKLKEFVIVIEDRSASAKQGVLYFDDIRFTRGTPPS